MRSILQKRSQHIELSILVEQFLDDVDAVRHSGNHGPGRNGRPLWQRGDDYETRNRSDWFDGKLELRYEHDHGHHAEGSKEILIPGLIA